MTTFDEIIISLCFGSKVHFNPGENSRERANADYDGVTIEGEFSTDEGSHQGSVAKLLAYDPGDPA